MVRASCDGRLNFREASSDDPRWMLRERLVLRQTERDLVLEALKVRQAYLLARSETPTEDDGTGRTSMGFADAAREYEKEIVQRLIPWEKKSTEQALKSEVASMRAEYERKFGPLTKEKLAEIEAHDREALKARTLLAKQAAEAAVANELALNAAMQDFRAKRLVRARG